MGLSLELPGVWGQGSDSAPSNNGSEPVPGTQGAGLGAARAISTMTVQSLDQGWRERRVRQQQHSPK